MAERLNFSRKSEIIAALQTNPNTSQVAREFGDVCQYTVWKIAKEEGIKLAVTTRRDATVTALQANPCAGQVARDLGISRGAIRNIAKKAGIDLGKPGGRPMSPDRRDAIVTALQANPCAKQVARDIGNVSDDTVRNIAKKAGIELRRGRPPKSSNRPLALDRPAGVQPALKPV